MRWFLMYNHTTNDFTRTYTDFLTAPRILNLDNLQTVQLSTDVEALPGVTKPGGQAVHTLLGSELFL